MPAPSTGVNVNFCKNIHSANLRYPIVMRDEAVRYI